MNSKLIFLLIIAISLCAACVDCERNSTNPSKPVKNGNKRSKTTTTTPKSEDDDDEFAEFKVFDEGNNSKRNPGKLGDSIAKAVQNFTTSNRNFDIGSLFRSGTLGNIFGFRFKREAVETPNPVTELVTDTVVEKNSAIPEEGSEFEVFHSRAFEEDTQRESNEDDDFDFDAFLKDDSGEVGTRNSNNASETDAEVLRKLGEEITKQDQKLEMPLSFDETNNPNKTIVKKESNINKIPKKTNNATLNRLPKSLNANLLKKTEEVLKNVVQIDEMKFQEDILKMKVDNVHHYSGIENLLDVYRAERMIQNWDNIKTKLSPTCRMDMTEFLAALKQRRMWALKMDDASGRYTTGYFWGNGYWSGSPAQCEHIALPPEERVNKTGVRKSGLTGNYLQMSEGFEPAPFDLAFYMVKMQLNSSVSEGGPNTVQLGLCLPYNCTSSDIMLAMEESKSPTVEHILGVRVPKHSTYDMFKDATFQILVGVSVIVLGLMIAGTLYEMALGSRLQKSASTSSDLPTNLKVEIAQNPGVPTVKISNGKSIYSLNMSKNNNNSEERLNVELPTMEEPATLNVFSELILSFSVISNLRTICDQTVGSDTLPCIHGLRSASMAWIILGHTCIIAFKYSDNPELRKVVEKEFFFQTVTNGAFSVDTFFCISGILVSYLYFRTTSAGKLDRLTQGTKGFVSGFLQFIGLLGYRFARLTAPYMFMLGVVEISMKWFYHNSVYEPPTDDHLNCPNYWWRNVLYINTLFPVEQMCMLWSWYLADDTQFYVIGAIILILATSHFKTAASIFFMFLVSSWGTTGYIAWSNNHMPSTDDPLALFDKIYDKPWTRLGPYLVGMATGWFLFKTNCKLRMSAPVFIVGWILSSSILLGLVYGLYNAELNALIAATYSSLSHTAWAIAISWIVVACSTGYGGYANSLLSASILYPFSRVTYCAYLVHPVVIRFMAMHLDHPIHLGKLDMTVIFLGLTVLSYFISFIISIAFEAPVVTMLKILAPNKRKKLNK